MATREVRVEGCEPIPITQGTHILTVAEAGFSMLDQYGRHGCGLSVEEIRKFADRVNRTGESGSLHPRAPVSAVPRAYLRGEQPPGDIARHIEKFLAANSAVIRAARLVIDLRVGPAPVPAEAIAACRRSLDQASQCPKAVLLVL